MDKKVKPAEIDEKAIIASFASDEPTDYQSLIGGSGKAADPLPQAEPPKEETRRRKMKGPDYESLFIRDAFASTRSGKTVYIRPEFHKRITKIVRVIGGNEISLFSYLDNVLEHHFNT
jgi:hypothetical protein